MIENFAATELHHSASLFLFSISLPMHHLTPQIWMSSLILWLRLYLHVAVRSCEAYCVSMQMKELETLLMSYIDQEKKLNEHLTALGTARNEVLRHRFAFQDIQLPPSASQQNTNSRSKGKSGAGKGKAGTERDSVEEDADDEEDLDEEPSASVLSIPTDPNFGQMFDNALTRAEAAMDPNFAKKHPKYLEFRHGAALFPSQ